MSEPRPGDPALHARVRGGDEETRYRAVAALDAGAPADLALLLERLTDPSWRVRSAVVDRLSAAPDPRALVGPLADALSGGATIGARDAAGAALARIGGPAVPVLVERLGAGHGDGEARQAAAAVLGLVGDRRAVAPLTAQLADRDVNVRSAAAEALGRIGGVESAAALRAALASDDAVLRLAAVEGLAALRVCPQGLPYAELVADPALRRPAYRMLGACDDPGVLALVAAGVADPARSAREAALAAIGQQRSRRPVAELAPLAEALRAVVARQPAAADACAAALGSEEPYVQVGALTALTWIGAPRHVRAALALAEDERHRALVEEALERMPAGAELRVALADALPDLGALARVTALAGLARLGSPAALESLVREASDPEAFVQGEAIAALGRIGDGRAVSPLAGLLGDDAPAVAGAAAAALVSIAGASGAARLAALAALRARAGSSPSAALYRALGVVGEPDDLEPLRAGLRSDSAAQRIAAAGAVGALAHRGLLRGRPVPELVAALAHPDRSVRVAAARAFGEISRARGPGAWREESLSCREALTALQIALGDPEASVQAAAAEALGACGRPEHAPAVAALVADEGAPALVVVAALRALVALGAPPAAAIARAAAHADPEVAKEAVLAAAHLPGGDGERLLREAAASPRWDVRQAAARAMAERGDAALAAEAARLAADDPDPLVARAFAEAAHALGAR
jgi:HEAT repeat protein